MAHANPYTPGQVETLEQAQNELVKLADVVNQIIANQKMVQRDDGCLADCAVVPHTLSDEVVRMIGHFELLGAYAARPYQKGQVVTYRDRMYVCVIPHQGGTVMDTAAWRLIGKAGCCCEGEAAGYDVGYSEGEAAGYARGYSEGKAAGSSSGSGGGSSGDGGSGGGGSGGSTPVKPKYSIYYGPYSKHSDDRSTICTGSIGGITLTGESQGYCKGVDSSGNNHSLAINTVTS